MFGTTTFELSLTRNYVSRWGMAQAVRELIQNALDSESPFVYEFTREDDKNVLHLNSALTTLPPQTLLLGATSKADNSDCIGSFGEGYKIALLVLTRLGYEVEMRNGDVLWRPNFRHNKRFGEEILCIDESSLNDRTNRGLTFVVKGLTEADVDEIRASCLQMQDHIGQIHSTRFGEILLERPGRLYVGGLFVCETGLKFGYNVRPEHLKLERDRQTVSGWDLRTITRDMWFDTEQFDRIAQLIDEKTPDLEYAEYSSPSLVKEACYRLFLSRHPGAVVAQDHKELKQLVEQGMTKVVQVSGVMYSQVRHAPSYYSRPTVHLKMPTQRLEEWFAEAKYHMGDKTKKSFLKLIEESKSWTLK